MPVRVVTDSACDLPDDLIERYGIEVVPLTIRFGHEELVDRKELSTDEFWRRLADSDVLPETSAPSAGAFGGAFRRLIEDGATRIICINLSSKLSATLQSAQVAGPTGRRRRSRPPAPSSASPRCSYRWASGACASPPPGRRRTGARSTRSSPTSPTAGTDRSCTARSTRSSSSRRGGGSATPAPCWA